jgi:hypothetical protein
MLHLLYMDQKLIDFFSSELMLSHFIISSATESPILMVKGVLGIQIGEGVPDFSGKQLIEDIKKATTSLIKCPSPRTPSIR